MTAAPIAEHRDDDQQLFCYRHPTRETWIRCGRCDRPICTSCAMQGPVGSRCRKCGTLAFDPLTSFTPAQIVLGLAAAVGGGLLLGYVGARLDFFSIVVGYFGGLFVADVVRRATGYKRGPVMLMIAVGGIAIGTTIGAVAGFTMEWGWLLDVAGQEEAEPLRQMLLDGAIWATLSVGAACVGAWSRLR